MKHLRNVALGFAGAGLLWAAITCFLAQRVVSFRERAVRASGRVVSQEVSHGTEKDSNGFISRLKSDGLLDSRHFINSGVNGALLDAPKGLALPVDPIWTADIDVARAVDSHPGRPLATVDVRPLHRASFRRGTLRRRRDQIAKSGASARS